MKVTIIGSGYVGLVTGACLAELGNQVFCLDLDQKKIDLLNGGSVPIYEPGLEEMILRNRAAGRIQFSTDIEAAVNHGDIQYIAVGTPPDEDGSADLQYVLSAARNIGRYMTSFKVVIDKSTVPVGTADKVKAEIADELIKAKRQVDYSVVSNPEFLKEGAAIEDFMRPDRIVVGTYDDELGQRARELMRKLYAPFNRHHERTYYMDVRSAELAKYAANAMLATRISFMNELANLAEKVGADIEHVRQGIGSDSRIGYGFLYAGTGYGGSCFPKDVQALHHSGAMEGFQFQLLDAVMRVNDKQKTILLPKIKTYFQQDLTNKKLAIWGLSFKPDTDDIREAPALYLIQALLDAGASVTVYDPEAMDNVSTQFGDRLHYALNPYQALETMDGLIICTEWSVFRSPDFAVMRKNMNQHVIFDGRNIFEPEEVRAEGFDYFSIGR